MRLLCVSLVTLLCVSLGSAVKIAQYEKEVYAFSYLANASVYENIPWNKLTTLVLVGLDPLDDNFIYYAQKNQVQVQMQSTFRRSHLNDEQYKTKWIKRKVDLVLKHNLQGINFHFNDEIDAQSSLSDQLTGLVQSLASELRQRVPDSKLSFNVPWASHNAIGSAVDNRNYDYLSIYDIVDHFVVHSFHIASQQFIGNEYQDEECYAHPTSGLYASAGGVMSWISFVQNNGSLSPSPKTRVETTFAKSLENNPEARDLNKIIYVQPWFGIDYACVRYEQFNRCILPTVWYRGVNCTDRSGSLRTLTETNDIFNKAGSTWQYDPASATGYVQYFDEANRMHQIWYDNPEALGEKYNFINEFEIGGTGVYALNFIDYTNAAMVDSLFNPLPDHKSTATKQ